MGTRNSKQTKTKRGGGADPIMDLPNTSQDDRYQIYDPEKYDLEMIQLLKKEFRQDPEMFILNNLLMAVMFIEDYDKEIRSLVNTLPQDLKLNSRLIEDHQKQILLPDDIFESVNNKVRYVNKNGALEPLASQRMCVLHHTIEIEDNKENADYSRIDTPSYRAALEESSDNAGFVKVNLLGRPRSSKESTFSIDSSTTIPLYQSTSDVNKDDQSNMDGSDSGVNSEYDYGRITAARTPQSLYISKKDIYTNLSQLPSQCITSVNVKNDFAEADSENEDEENFERDVPLYHTRHYLNSKEFMSHFKNNIFPNYLGEVFGFSEDDILAAKSIPGSVFCNSEGNCSFWEIIPTIPIPWPSQIAFEWSLRRRRTVWDKRDKKPIAYKWPTDKMLSEASTLTCVVVPRGFMPKRGKNPHIDIEWELEFPKAERYLELRMSHAQTKIYLFLIIIHKYCLEPITQKHGLLVEHIRNLMFWECEANYKAWPEDKLGTKLVLVLQNLYQYLSKQQMSHYFLRNKNILKNMPTKYIIPSQQKIHRIKEAPLQMMISALRNVKYVSDNFYPEPDLDELFDIITSSNVLPFEAQMNIMALEKAQQQATKKQAENNKKYRDKDQQWHRRMREQQKIAQKRKLIKKSEDIKNLQQMEVEHCKESQEWNFSVKKRFANDIARQIRLLTFFVSLFIDIAKKSLKKATTKQTLFYLKQAEYLNALLDPIDSETANKFRKEIEDEEAKCQKKQVEEPKIPVTPKRNSSAFDISKQLILKGRSIDRFNLSESFDANVAGSSGVKKKKVKVQHQSPADKINNNKAEMAPSVLSPIEETKNKIEVAVDIHRETANVAGSSGVKQKKVRVQLQSPPIEDTKNRIEVAVDRKTKIDEFANTLSDVDEEIKIPRIKTPEKSHNDEIINSVKKVGEIDMKYSNDNDKVVNDSKQEPLLTGEIVNVGKVTETKMKYSSNNETELSVMKEEPAINTPMDDDEIEITKC